MEIWILIYRFFDAGWVGARRDFEVDDDRDAPQAHGRQPQRAAHGLTSVEVLRDLVEQVGVRDELLARQPAVGRVDAGEDPERHARLTVLDPHRPGDAGRGVGGQKLEVLGGYRAVAG